MVNNQLIHLFRQNKKFLIGFRYIIYVLQGICCLLLNRLQNIDKLY